LTVSVYSQYVHKVFTHNDENVYNYVTTRGAGRGGAISPEILEKIKIEKERHVPKF
jgi:hypothetical protein